MKQKTWFTPQVQEDFEAACLYLIMEPDKQLQLEAIIEALTRDGLVSWKDGIYSPTKAGIEKSLEVAKEWYAAICRGKDGDPEVPVTSEGFFNFMEMMVREFGYTAVPMLVRHYSIAAGYHKGYV